MPKILLLFDIDGTIMLVRGAGMNAMRRVAARLFGESFRWEGVTAAGHLDPLIFAEAAALNDLDVETHDQTFHEHYIRELEIELQQRRREINALPGIHDVLAHLHERAEQRGDIVLGLLTGNYARAARLKLAAIGVDVDWFRITAFGDEGTSRPALVELAMRKFEQVEGEPPDPRRVVVIGDTPRDIACAHAHGCVAFAVATGPFAMEELAAQRPDVLVPDLSNPAPLYALINGD